MKTAVLTTSLLLLIAINLLAGEPAPTGPQPKFQGDFFGEMARSFATIVSTDTKAMTMTAKLDKDSSLVTIPIRYDTELHMRDSWCELGDYFSGQHVMLFVYVDEERKWTWPRAVQDDIHVAANHRWYAKVTAVDKTAKTYATHREEKDQAGKVTKEIDNSYPYDADVKVWKGETPGNIDSLQLGDEVIQQLVEKDGKKVAVEIITVDGDKAIRTVQDAKHKQDEEKLGLPAYVNDFDPLTGACAITVAWSSANRAKQFKPGDSLAISPVDGGKNFAAAVSSIQTVDSRTRLNLVINSRVAAHLSYGQYVRVWIPGNGPELPTGKSGIPDLNKK